MGNPKVVDGSQTNSSQSKEKVIDNVIEQLTERQRAILNILKISVIENVIESTTTIARKTGVSPRTIMRDLNELRTKGLVRHVGPAKGGYWEILK